MPPKHAQTSSKSASKSPLNYAFKAAGCKKGRGTTR